MTDLRMLSLHQPWASLVAVGVKSIETRSWPTKHRGRIGIASTVKKPVVGPIGRWEAWAADPPGKIHPNHTGPRPARLYCNDLALWAGAGSWCALPRGAIVATANLVDCVPIVDDGAARNCVDVRVARPNADAALRIDDEAGREQIRNVREQIPYGDFTPGRWAWLLDDVKPTTERCPACWGECYDPSLPCTARPETRCTVCNGAGVCDPVPVKGRQRLWRWNP